MALNNQKRMFLSFFSNSDRFQWEMPKSGVFASSPEKLSAKNSFKSP